MHHVCSQGFGACTCAYCGVSCHCWLLCALQVKTEHDILGQLSQQTLSFKVPAAKPALGSGEPYVVLSNGAAACVFEIIPGMGGVRKAWCVYVQQRQQLRLQVTAWEQC